MEQFFYNKSGRVASFVARDCLILEPGERLPTISDYCGRFGVSRGVVQNAIAFLQEEGCIRLETSGTRGTFLVSVVQDKLVAYTGWDTVSVSMPLPFDLAFSSLATAINEFLEKLPLPASFAYISDAANRIRFLDKNFFDCAVFSLSTADYYTKKIEQLDLPIILTGATFSYPYALFTKSAIHDGTRMLYDPASHDHSTLTHEVAKGHRVEFVQMPYALFSSVLARSDIDAIVVRQEPWTQKLAARGFHKTVLDDFDDYPTKKSTIPALLTNRENYGMHQLLLKYLDLEQIAKTQRDVLLEKRPPKVY